MNAPASRADALVWLGCLFLALAALFAAHSYGQERAFQHATATVTENVASVAQDGRVLYAPRLRFRLPAGEIVQVLATPGTEEPRYAAGTDLPVTYRAGDPGSAVIATFWRVYAAAIWLAIAGTVLFDVGWILRGLRRQRASGA